MNKKIFSYFFFFPPLAKEVNRLYGINYHISIYIRIDICQGEPCMTKTNRHTDSFYANGAIFCPLPISIRLSKFLYEKERGKGSEEKRRL